MASLSTRGGIIWLELQCFYPRPPRPSACGGIRAGIEVDSSSLRCGRSTLTPDHGPAAPSLGDDEDQQQK